MKKWILALILLALTIFVILPFLSKNIPLFKGKPSHKKESERYSDNIHPEVDFMGIPKECQDYNFTKFTNHITNLNTTTMIVPPGTFDTYEGKRIIKTHSYIVGVGERPIYAPADSIAFEGTKYLEEGMVQYSVFFMADCDLMFIFDHIQKPVEKLKNEIEKVDNKASQDSRTSSFKKALKFSSGELIGHSTGTKLAKHWDFGVYDLTSKNFLKDSNIPNVSGRDNYARCPFDYFPDDMKQEYIKKFGNLRTNETIPDTFCKTN